MMPCKEERDCKIQACDVFVFVCVIPSIQLEVDNVIYFISLSLFMFRWFVVALLAGAVDSQLAFGLLEVLDHVGDRADLDPPLPCKGDAAFRAKHARVLSDGLTWHLVTVVDELADDADFGLASESAQVRGRLSVAATRADTSRHSSQGQDVTRAT